MASEPAPETSHKDADIELLKACLKKNIAEIEHIIKANLDNPGLYKSVRSEITKCAQGGNDNAKVLVALMKYPHLPLHSSIGSDEFISRVVFSGAIEIFQAMLIVGWDPCSPLKHLGDALTYAVMKNRPSVVFWLLDNGAKYDANEAWEPFSILAKAARFASPVIIERLLAVGAPLQDSRALEMAVIDGRIDSLACLLDNGADINEIAAETSAWIKYDREAVENGYGAALHVAARRGHLQAVRFFIDRGANIGLKDSKGRTALDLATIEKHSTTVDLLESFSS